MSTVALLLATGSADAAGRLMDYIRNYDLNDYALGLSFSVSQSPYAGGEHSKIGYPVLTSFRDASMTNDWLLISDGDVGIRWVSQGQWELGVVGRLQTLGFGTTDSPRLLGMDDRKWGLEMGPLIGYRKWPVHVRFRTYTELFGRHDGLISQLSFELPIEHEHGFLVPSLQAIHQSSDYTKYYFGVAPFEANRLRPAYTPGSATNFAARLRWGWALTDKWLLYGDLGVEYLDSAISESPIVNRDQIVSGSISLAYNNDIFQPRYSDTPPPEQPRLEMRLGVFSDNIKSTVVRDPSDGGIGSDIDVENLLGLSDEETLFHFDGVYRIGDYHRLELGYLASDRQGSTILSEDIEFGDVSFPAGSEITSEFESRIVRLSYAYSILNDHQKELGVMGGVHFTEFNTRITSSETGQTEITNGSTPLPVIGLHGALSLGRHSSLGARIQFFRMDFHRYEGSLNFATLHWKRRIGDTVSLGLGYNYYGLNLDSRDNDVRGTLEIRHHGPEFFLNLSF